MSESAFPIHSTTGDPRDGVYATDGLTKREYFAAHADIPWNACLDAMQLKGIANPSNKNVVEYKAILAVLYADMLIEYLSQKQLENPKPEIKVESK